MSIRISSSSKPGIKRMLRMGTLNQVPDTEDYLAGGTEAKMWVWNLDAGLARAKRIKRARAPTIGQ